MADIFLSYKREDREAVEPLVRLLEAEKFAVWWDPEIVPGERFSKVIRGALDDASCVIVAWSHRSVDSHWVQDEAGLARDRGVLVPVSIDGVEPPLGFRQLQTVELSDWTGESNDPRIRRLLAGVRRLVGKPHDPAADRSSIDRGRVDTLRKLQPGKGKRAWLVVTGLLGVATAAATLAATAMFLYLQRPQPEPIYSNNTAADPAVYRAFPDCEGGCPVMLVVPTGSFLMGSPDGEPQRGNDEGPQHQVTIPKTFAAGRYPVTFDEWDFCNKNGGCAGLHPDDHGWGRGTRPVINVSWEDAQIYVKWLSQFTGQTYRLLTEAEREYITRAGKPTPFWWGDRISARDANYDSTKKYTDEPTGDFRNETVPVDAFRANPWGFSQVSGNTWDWVEDCYHDSYDGAPTNGSAWTTSDCSRHVLRGGSWDSQPRNVRSAARWREPTDTREEYYGFRVARVCDEKCDK